LKKDTKRISWTQKYLTEYRLYYVCVRTITVELHVP